MHPTKRRALQILAEAQHGREILCDCGHRSCDRNYPGAEDEAWAQGVLAGMAVDENQAVSPTEIAHWIETYRKRVGR